MDPGKESGKAGKTDGAGERKEGIHGGRLPGMRKTVCVERNSALTEETLHIL